METRTIRTSAGDLELVAATIDQLRGIARYWPMALIQYAEMPVQYGLVFQRGEEEICGVKMQPPDVAEPKARVAHHANRALIAAAIPCYLEKQHRGVMVPCAYYKEKPTGLAESGIALFVGPDPASKPVSMDRRDVLFDRQLGDGATSMVFDMLGAIGEARQASALPLMPAIGVELRPHLALGRLAMHFVVEGRNVFVVKDPLVEDEPVWAYVVRAGFSQLPYAPMQPTSIPDVPLGINPGNRCGD